MCIVLLVWVGHEDFPVVKDSAQLFNTLPVVILKGSLDYGQSVSPVILNGLCL